MVLYIVIILLILISVFSIFYTRTDPLLKKILYGMLVVIIFVITLRFLGPIIGSVISSVLVILPWLDRMYNMIGLYKFLSNKIFEGTINNNAMSEEEALGVLGLAKGASVEEINEAYKKLMGKIHPDKGGSDYLASKLNQARDYLIKHYGG